MRPYLDQRLLLAPWRADFCFLVFISESPGNHLWCLRLSDGSRLSSDGALAAANACCPRACWPPTEVLPTHGRGVNSRGTYGLADVNSWYKAQISIFWPGFSHLANASNHFIQQQKSRVYTYLFLGKPSQKKTVLFGKVFPNVWTHSSNPPGFLWDFGKRKVKFGSKMAIFGMIWGGFKGFGPCLGISHPNPTTFGKDFSNKTSFFGRLSLALYDKTQCLEHILILSQLTIMIRKLLDAHAHLLHL